MRIIKSFILVFALLSMGVSTEAKKKAAHMIVASYNIRYANHQDSLQRDGWGQRYPVMARLIRSNGFEIFGTQEGLKKQLDELKAALPGFDYIGIGRDDGLEAGEHSAIFYRTDLFRLIDHGDFWLSEHPECPGLGWDAVCPRICSWGHFRHLPSGREFLFFNLHMDHVGVVARREAAKLVVAKIREIAQGEPVILTGDFNVDQNDEIYTIFTKSGLLKDAYDAARIRFAENGTFNAFKTNYFTTSRIDHVFVSPSAKVEAYGVFTDSYWTPDDDPDDNIKASDAPQQISFDTYIRHNPSDHYPVFVRVKLDSVK